MRVNATLHPVGGLDGDPALDHFSHAAPPVVEPVKGAALKAIAAEALADLADADASNADPAAVVAAIVGAIDGDADGRVRASAIAAAAAAAATEKRDEAATACANLLVHNLGPEVVKLMGVDAVEFLKIPINRRLDPRLNPSRPDIAEQFLLSNKELLRGGRAGNATINPGNPFNWETSPSLQAATWPATTDLRATPNHEDMVNPGRMEHPLEHMAHADSTPVATAMATYVYSR